MNIDRVNSTLTKATMHMQAAELDEMYVGSGGNIDTPDAAYPGGDPKHGGAGGVDNMETDADQFDSYIEDVVASVMEKCNISEDAAYQALVTVSTMQARQGRVPPMPHVDKATPEQLATWAGAAKTGGLAGMVIDYCLQRAS